MTEIAIKIEKLTDKDMIISFYNFESDKLKIEDPISELKALETLVNSLKIFEETKLYDAILINIRTRLARLLAFYHLPGDVNAVTNT